MMRKSGGKYKKDGGKTPISDRKQRFIDGDERLLNPKSKSFRKKKTDSGRTEEEESGRKKSFKGKFRGADFKEGLRGRNQGDRRKKPAGTDYSKSTAKPATTPKKTVKREDDGTVRLNRYLANAGVCSRREADKYIESGIVTVNGKTVTELGVRVKRTDVVCFSGERLSIEDKVYLLLNKPKGFVTTMDDPHAEKTVMDLVQNACEERIYPVGRLDKDTTGLLLFTNDGDLAKKLTHPSGNKRKIYHAFLDKEVTKADMITMSEGLELEDGFIAPDAIQYVNREIKNEIGIEIHSGKNRVVRRFFAHMGYHVEKLDRVYFAGLTKKNLPRGKYRFLSKKEISFLKMGG
ncbi:rRNA pseudouridine synthase [Puteibacter caeruleilacunae]|nr:rRNA pseudouridine synthase [Puteibacter caeruleilacunae]